MNRFLLASAVAFTATLGFSGPARDPCQQVTADRRVDSSFADFESRLLAAIEQVGRSHEMDAAAAALYQFIGKVREGNDVQTRRGAFAERTAIDEVLRGSPLAARQVMTWLGSDAGPLRLAAAILLGDAPSTVDTHFDEVCRGLQRRNTGGRLGLVAVIVEADRRRTLRLTEALTGEGADTHSRDAAIELSHREGLFRRVLDQAKDGDGHAQARLAVTIMQSHHEPDAVDLAGMIVDCAAPGGLPSTWLAARHKTERAIEKVAQERLISETNVDEARRWSDLLRAIERGRSASSTPWFNVFLNGKDAARSEARQSLESLWRIDRPGFVAAARHALDSTVTDSPGSAQRIRDVVKEIGGSPALDAVERLAALAQ